MGLTATMQEFSDTISEDTFAHKKLLIIEHDAILNSFLKEQFRKEGFEEIFGISKNEKVSELVLSKLPDLILLGCDRSEKNEEYFLETNLCAQIRKKGIYAPIIVLLDKAHENLGKKCLDAGADYYISKPLRFSELLSIVRSLLRVSTPNQTFVFELFGLKFDLTSKWLISNVANTKIALTEKEAEILLFLFEEHPKGVQKDCLLREIWGLQKGLSTHTLETHIYRLRKKIKDHTNEPIILTHGTTYKLADNPKKMGQGISLNFSWE